MFRPNELEREVRRCLDLIRAGEPDSAAALLRCIHEPLLTLARNRFPRLDEDEVHDIVNAAYVELVSLCSSRAPETLEQLEQMMNRQLYICWRRHTSENRRRKKSLPLATVELVPVPEPAEPTTSVGHHHYPTVEELQAAVDALPEGDPRTVARHCLAGETRLSIKAIMNISTSMVRTHRREAQALLNEEGKRRGWHKIVKLKPKRQPRSPATRVSHARPFAGQEFGDYRLTHWIADGGEGEIWRAQTPAGGAHVLKLVAENGVTQSTVDFAPAARKHPNLYYAPGFVSNGFQVTVMREAEGSLMDMLARSGEGTLPLCELLKHMQEVAECLDYLNPPWDSPARRRFAHRVQHCDIKPHNLLVFDGMVMVADCTLAEVCQESRRVRDCDRGCSTEFAAPELLRNRLTTRSDQYSLAVTYCVLRGGNLPYRGTEEQIVQAQQANAFDLSMLHRSERPVVARALNREPRQRWASCTEFVDHLIRRIPDAVDFRDRLAITTPDILRILRQSPDDVDAALEAYSTRSLEQLRQRLFHFELLRLPSLRLAGLKPSGVQQRWEVFCSALSQVLGRRHCWLMEDEYRRWAMSRYGHGY